MVTVTLSSSTVTCMLSASPAAASALKESVDHLQQARAKLDESTNSKNRNTAGESPAVASQKEALAKMAF